MNLKLAGACTYVMYWQVFFSNEVEYYIIIVNGLNLKIVLCIPATL